MNKFNNDLLEISFDQSEYSDYSEDEKIDKE